MKPSKVQFSYLLSRLRDSACAGMHVTCLSFFGPLYGPPKGQHTLYCLFDCAAICFFLLAGERQGQNESMVELF